MVRVYSTANKPVLVFDVAYMLQSASLYRVRKLSQRLPLLRMLAHNLHHKSTRRRRDNAVHANAMRGI